MSEMKLNLSSWTEHRSSALSGYGSYLVRSIKVYEDRIEELEANLAKATEALERIAGGEFDGVMLLSLPPKDAARSYAASILAKLKGDKQ